MSLNSLESEGLRPLRSLLVVRCLLGANICVVSVSVTFPIDDFLWFHFGFVFHSEAQVPTFVSRQWKFQGGFGPALEPELLTSILTWATCAWKQLNSLVAMGLEYLWEEPPIKEECGTMEIKRLWRVHPPTCLPRKTCCDFFPATFVVKLRARLSLRDLFHLPWTNVCKYSLVHFLRSSLKANPGGFLLFSLMRRNSFQRHCIISGFSASLEERNVKYLTLEPLLSPDVCFAQK